MRPIKFAKGGKAAVSTQFGALCYRVRNNKVQVLLVTSRETRRWIVPKGWPMNGATPHEAALQEAWEEAGVKGKLQGNSLGIYSYVKKQKRSHQPCVVVVFAIKVRTTAKAYPEAHERRRKWFSLKKAANKVQEPELRQMIETFDPKMLVR